MKATEILTAFEERLVFIETAIRELVDIESPSHNAEQSRKVVNWVERYVHSRSIPLIAEKHAAKGGEHLVIRAFSHLGGKPTLLLGHTDTVHPVGTATQNPTRLEGDRFYGCGIFDMKANVVLMLEALALLHQRGLKPSTPITILLSCDEEVGSFSGRALVEKEAAASERCLVLEPSSDGRIKTGRKGTGVFTLVAHGHPAHAGLEPEKGANAIAELAKQIDQIHSVARPDLGTTVNVCTIAGGTTSNVIPEHAQCQIDVRFSTASEAERVHNALRGLNSTDPRVTLNLLGDINRPPMERSPEVVAFFENAKALAASFDYQIDEIQVGGASDGNFVAAVGVPVLDGVGVAGAGAHMLTEHILISDIAKRATLVTLLLMN